MHHHCCADPPIQCSNLMSDCLSACACHHTQLLADLVRAVHQAAGHHRAEFIYNIHLDEDHPRVVKSDSCSKERMVGGACNLGEAAPICPFSYK